MPTRAVVLRGGGVAGIAWEMGMLAGLAEAGIDIRKADLFLGTSAGAFVAAQITSGLTPEELLKRQLDPSLASKELSASPDFPQIIGDLRRVVNAGGTSAEILQGIGAVGHSPHRP